MVTTDTLKDHIIRHLKWDSSLKGSRIKVELVNRTAVLTGTVPNLVAHEIAQRDAQSIPGVERVENQLTVKFEHNHPNRTDAKIESNIKSLLGCTADIDARQVKVQVIDGIVTLNGTIDSFWKRDRIEDLASSVDGILAIKNELRVLLTDKSPDIFIKKDILSALERMEVQGLEKLQVKVKDGIVSLSGTVPTWSIKFDVEDTARFTSGVIEVKNHLSVE